MAHNYRDFDDVFSFEKKCSYTAGEVQSISQHRSDLQGLFVDKVMSDCGIQRPAKVYPPRTHAELKTLHKTLIESAGSEAAKLAILYYIFLDLDAQLARRDLAATFVVRFPVPHAYRILMEGLWHLDRLNFAHALQYLTEPCLAPTFADDILSTLVRFAEHNDLTLALAYYHTVRPVLSSGRALDDLFTAVARTSITEAFHFQRGQPTAARRPLFHLLIRSALLPDVSRTGGPAERGVELANLPLHADEERWFDEYLARGEGRTLPHANATRILRLLGTGRVDDVAALKGVSGKAVAGLDWSMLVAAAQKGLGPRATC